MASNRPTSGRCCRPCSSGRSRSGSGRLLEVGEPTLFETPFAPGQPRLFGLAATRGDDCWLKALLLEDYAPRRARPEMLQQALFPHHEVWG